MAPEIIELCGATPASDIWSLGCTVIELLQGKPPYYHLQAMPALFAIVNIAWARMKIGNPELPLYVLHFSVPPPFARR